MNAYGQLCQADGTSTNESLPTLPWDTRRRQKHPGRPCLSYPFNFRLIPMAASTQLVRGGGRWGCPIKSLGTRCIRKVRTVIIYRGFQIGDANCFSRRFVAVGVSGAHMFTHHPVLACRNLRGLARTLAPPPRFQSCMNAHVKAASAPYRTSV